MKQTYTKKELIDALNAYGDDDWPVSITVITKQTEEEQDGFNLAIEAVGTDGTGIEIVGYDT